MINIKNSSRNKNITLFDDFKKIFEEEPDMEYIETFEMHHQSKKHLAEYYGIQEDKQFKEPIMVFRKK